MGLESNRARVVEALRRSSRALDDDELSDYTGIPRRQTVNQICRALAREGVTRRFAGPDGKLVNDLLNYDTSDVGLESALARAPTVRAPAENAVQPAPDRTPPPGSSREQRAAERVMLDVLGEKLGRRLEPATIRVPSGARVEVDGCDSGRTVLVECWAHQGPPKAAQRHKVLADAFKLTWISSTMYPKPQVILCLSDPAAARPFVEGARSWAAQALHDLAVTVSLVELPADIRQNLRKAQRRQYR